MLSQPAVTALNHLLVQSGWALQRLAPHAGKTARFNIAPFSFAYTIQSDGTLCAAAADASADASCTIPPSLLPRLALQDEAAYQQVERFGDADLVSEIFYLGHNLSWDAAEDLSHVTGDMVAERAVQLARAGHEQVRSAILNVSQALAEYWTEERPLLAKSAQLAGFARQLESLREGVDRLEQRIDRLTPS